MLSVEILVSTINRTSLDFLWEMFKHNDPKGFNILIINQTTEGKTLESDWENIRVFNCFEYGIPKSRNLAIKNSRADVCLMADDDIVYQPGLKKIIQDAYLNYSDADMISFQAVKENGDSYADYYPEGQHTKKTLRKIFTWVISFKRRAYLENHVLYNSHFGFNAAFQGCEEYVFLRNALDSGLKMVHVEKVIVTHPDGSSGTKMGSDNAFYAKSAMSYRFNGNLSYIWLLKYTLYMWKDGYIRFSEMPGKFWLGVQGITKYKALKRSGEIDKIYES